MFEQLVSEAASRFNVPTASTSALVRGVLAMLTNDATGGAEGFFDRFRRAGLGDTLNSWVGGKEGRPLTPAHIESALEPKALDTLAGASGLTRVAMTTILSYLLPRLIGLITPNGALPSTSALKSQLAGYLGAAAPSVDTRSVPAGARIDPTEARTGMPRWIPWAAAAALLLLALVWMRPSGGTIDPQLSLVNKEGRITYSGVVRDDETRRTIVNSLNTAFGQANVEGNIRVDRNARPASWLPRLDGLLTAVRRPGVELALAGDAVKIGGWLSEAERQALASNMRGMLGARATIGTLGDPAADTVRAANDQALTALRALGTSGVAPDRVVQAMNLAVINFPTASASIPPDALPVIRQSATVIKAAPAGSRIEIGGHTDNVGDPSKNMALAQSRADAVRAALVQAGAPAEYLVTRSYGDSRPRATNDTEYGRFQNRRIEYSVVR